MAILLNKNYLSNLSCELNMYTGMYDYMSFNYKKVLLFT